MFCFNIKINLNGFRGTIPATSDQTLAEIFDANNLNYEGVNITLAGKTLGTDDYNRQLGDVIRDYMSGIEAPDTVFVNGVKRQDCAA